MVHAWSIAGGATSSPNLLARAASSSRYTGLRSSSASTQCRIIGRLTASGASAGIADPSGWPTNSSSRGRSGSTSVVVTAARLLHGRSLRGARMLTVVGDEVQLPVGLEDRDLDGTQVLDPLLARRFVNLVEGQAL